MSDQKEQIIENLKNKRNWLRVLFMALFLMIYWIAEMVIFLVIFLQWISTIVTGETNEQLKTFGQSLSTYIYQIMRYLTYNTEDKPFPLAAWPSGEESDV